VIKGVITGFFLKVYKDKQDKIDKDKINKLKEMNMAAS